MERIEEILRLFTEGNVQEASVRLLSHLHIPHTQELPSPIQYRDYYDRGEIPQYIERALTLCREYYYIGEVCDDALAGRDNGDTNLREDLMKLRDNAHYKSMMLFAVDLRTDAHITRSDLSALTRAFNRLVYNYPATVIFRQGQYLSISTCERTEYKQESQKEQGEKLGKVCLLRDVDCINTQRGHIDILNSIYDKTYNTFDELYKHWMEVFSSELLTEKFYNELQNWYFWAVKNVAFPNDLNDDKDDKKYNNENVIRLITRFIFVWFLKEKGLVNPDLFDVEKLSHILKDFKPLSKDTNYYVGIIQNLFFATLNQEIANRQFVAKWDPNHHGIKTLFRNKRLFIEEDNEENIISLFNRSPYVNGSLFECLDNKERDGKTFCWDGFSESKTTQEGKLKQAIIPNYLFFMKEKGIDVDMQVEYHKEEPYYVKVSGLLTILKKYHFTIEENTPLDEDVALDPELLGRAFENLLGAFNPETQRTARENTGSYYTPRDIVNYMVSESMLAHLKTHCPNIPQPILESVIDFNITDKPQNITDQQVNQIVEAVYNCHVLDPACGSGAFPMGILQLLVNILRKLDDNNKFWYKIVLEQALEEVKIAGNESEEEERQRLTEEINNNFDDKVNDPDYARKLYIIEKCIFGVDIQTVAVQISRLRCFISLLCEQPINNNSEDNYGIKPLPNLESNFVAANTLISLNLTKDEETLLNENDVALLVKQLREVRHLLFLPRDKKMKIRLRDKDARLRQEIKTKVGEVYALRLKESIDLQQEAIDSITIWLDTEGAKIEDNKKVEVAEYDIFGNLITKTKKKGTKKSEMLEMLKNARKEKERLEHDNRLAQIMQKIDKLVSWDPFDQNVSNPYFEPKWMLGISKGFDIIIGNPPYIQLEEDKGKLAILYEPCGYETFNRKGNIYCLFYERGWQMLKQDATLCYITFNKWMRADYGKQLRGFLTGKTNPKILVDFGGVQVFESANVDTNILLFSKSNNTKHTQSTELKLKDVPSFSSLEKFVMDNHNYYGFEGDGSWVMMADERRKIKEKIEEKGKELKKWNIHINYGIKTGFNPAFVIDTSTRNMILANCKDAEERERTENLIRPMLRGKHIKKYGQVWKNWLIGTFPSRKFNIEEYPAVKNFLLSFTIEKLEQTGIKRIVDGKEVKARKKTNGKWFETQDSIAYWKDFDEPKIIYPNMTKYLPFYYDEKKFFTNDKCFIMTGEHLYYLVAFFNSSLFKYCFIDDFPPLGEDRRELRKTYFKRIRVLEVNDGINDMFKELVIDIQKEYSDEKAKAIDQCIFDLYGLTREEREAIGYIDFNNNSETDDEDDNNE